MPSSWLSTATRNVGSGLWSVISKLSSIVYTILWDTGLTLINIITPKKRLVATSWPEFVPPKATDSRSPCPALNALSNHAGIFPHDGRGITFKQMGDEVHKHYNFSRSFCYFVCSYIASILRRDYNTDSFDLSDIGVHNGIEHDGSITRYDTVRQPDQSKPDEKLIHDIISAPKEGKKLAAADVSRLLTTRLTHSKQTNGQFSLAFIHSFFAAANASTLLLIFGGELGDIKPFLLEERLPEDWSTKFRSRMGLTMGTFNSTVLRVLLGIDPSWKKVKKEE
ncbi:chloroperoxidase-like protein [Gautieria morchelliformis]|nr:chloroperoxidase-like protein [Gautieria morchelliformis]